MRAFSESNLALIHNAGCGALATGAGRIVLDHLRRRAREGRGEGALVDLGCGSGVLAEQISLMGFPVVGIDLSAHLVRLAQTRVPRGVFQVGSIYEAELPRAAAVTMIGEVVNYCVAGKPAAADLDALLQRIHAALEPGGLLLFDAAAPGRQGEAARQSFRHGPDWTVLVEQREDGRVLTREITTFRAAGDLYRRENEQHLLHLWPVDEMQEALARAGFSVALIDRYDDVALPPGLVGYRAERR